MGWHISAALMKDYENSLCSQGQEAESSEAICSDGEQSAQSSENLTPQAYLCSDRMTAFSRLSRYGMTFAPLTEDIGEGLLTWFREGFPARTLARQEKEQALTASVLVYGEKWHELSVRYDLDSSSWRIHHSLFPEDLPWSSVTLPKWGMTRNGFVYQHPTAERPISGIASGYSLPTPTCNQAPNKGANTNGPKSLLEVARGHWDHMWPTPNATDANKWNNQSLADRKANGQQIRLNTAVSPQGGAGGQLNPTWVEWLMGWPLGWTDLKPLEMARFVEWQQQHSEF